MYERNRKHAGAARWGRLKALAADVGGATRQGVRANEVRRAMTRAGYGLGVALAAVAALSVHEAIHATWR